ncbi:MAG: TetR/AcrR family transcriptional regulator [Gammaproteobacteria bacterium]|nr:TetR/AcrR family transcriptional regulator [Gammaproteobacteria bacterium]
MAWNKQHKQKTREKILQSAARLFTQQGYDAVGINDVMRDAGLTRGAFYAHFDSKQVLYAESIKAAARESLQYLDPDNDRMVPLGRVVQGYLSHSHREGQGLRCPLAFLVTDISHRDDVVRAAYTEVFSHFVALLAKQAGGHVSDSQTYQAAIFLIGGLAVSRAVSDEQLAENILQACREGIAAGPLLDAVR